MARTWPFTITKVKGTTTRGKDGNSYLRHPSNWNKEITEHLKWDRDWKEPKTVRNPFKDSDDKGLDPLKANVAPPPGKYWSHHRDSRNRNTSKGLYTRGKDGNSYLRHRSNWKR